MSRFGHLAKVFSNWLQRAVLANNCVAIIIGLLASALPYACAQSPGFLGYVLNSTDGTVSIFAAESDDSKIGNNDHLLSTVKVGSEPERIAVTPDGHYAFVSSPGDNSVWQIDVTDPTNPSASKITTFNSLGTPGGIAVTINQNNGDYLVWVADSKNCVMHVLDTTSGKEQGPNNKALPLVPPSTNPNATASCGTSIALPEVVATPDQQTAVFATFDQVKFTDSTTNPPTVTPTSPYVYAFDATLTNTDLLPWSFTFTLTDPRTLSTMQDLNGNFLLFIGEFGSSSVAPGVFAVGVPPGLTCPISITQHCSPEQEVVSYSAGNAPLALATNNLDGISFINSELQDHRNDVNFYLFVGQESGYLGVYPLDCGTSTTPSTSCTSTLTVGTAINLTSSGTPASVAAVPSSFKNDGRASIVYVTDNSATPLELVLGEGPGSSFGTPCIVGSAGCDTGGTVAGGQVYSTAVPVGNGPVGATFGPINPGSPALTWLTGYTTTGTSPYTPLQPSPSNSTASNPLPIYVDQGTGLTGIKVQALSMVSNLNSATLSSQIKVTSDTGNANYGCAAGLTTCTGPQGPETQSTTINVDGTPQNATTSAGDVTTISFQGAPNSGCTGSGCTQSASTGLKTKSLCTLQSNGGTAAITITQGSSVTADLSCTGVISDTLDGTITWGDPNSTSNSSSVSGIANGATTVTLPASAASFPTHSYNTPGPSFTISATATDTTDPNNQYVVAIANSAGITVAVTPTFSISGTISGPGGSGATVVLTSGATTVASATAGSSGMFTLSNISNGIYTLTVTNAGFNFTPASQSVTVNGANLSGVSFASATTTYSISGVISGTGGNAATVALSGTSTATTTASSSGAYSFTGLANGPYTVTPSNRGFVFTPFSQMETINGANIANVNFTAAAAPTFNITGTITGPGASGATVTLTGTSAATTSADGSGNYSFTGLLNGSYTITPTKTGFTFSPLSENVTVNGANITAPVFSSTANSAQTFSLSGTIANAGGSTVTLAGTSAAMTTADSSGNYSFSGLVNGTYTVTPSLTGYTFTPTSQSVTVNGANITAVNFVGHPPTFSISGTISGSGGGGAVVSLSGTSSASTIADTSGNFTFTGLVNGPYTVIPVKSGYGMSPASKTVAVNGTSVSGVNFTAITLLACSFNPFNPSNFTTAQQVSATLTCQGNPGDSLSGSITNWGDGSISPATTITVGNSGNAILSFTHTYVNASVSGTSETITANVTDNTNAVPTAGASATITVSLAPVNPIITPSITSAQLVPGQSALFKLGFQGNAADAGAVITIAAQSLPQGVTLSYSPNPLILDQNGVGTATVTINTTASSSSAAVVLPSAGVHISRFALAFGLPGMFGLSLAGVFANKRRPRKRVFDALLLVVCIAILGGVCGCGTSVSNSVITCSGCTPTGTANIVINATSQHPALQSSVTIQIQVGPTQ